MDVDVTVSNRCGWNCYTRKCAGRWLSAALRSWSSRVRRSSEWLYPEGERESVDVDLLLRPSQWDAAQSILEELGFEPTYCGIPRDRVGPVHSLDLQRTDAEQGLHGLDLHHYFPGIELTRRRRSTCSGEDRVPGEQAGIRRLVPQPRGPGADHRPSRGPATGD